MIIYIIIKFLSRYGFVFKKNGIKDEKFELIVDIIIIIIFFICYSKYKEDFKLLNAVFETTMDILTLYILYGWYKYIFENLLLVILKKLIVKINNKERIYKIVYYGIGLLPGNLKYGIYFGGLENGWYLRVWYNSNRDIFFGKYFKGDSRNFFYTIKQKKFIKLRSYKDIIKNRIKDMIYRIIFVLYLLRNIFIKSEIKQYMKIRIIIYMYLSIFYFLFISQLQILNQYLLFSLGTFDLIILIFMDKIIVCLYKRKSKIFKYFYEKFESYIIGIKKPTEDKLFTDTPYVLERTIGDVVLHNSISLNFLYEGILYVNEQTEGYYYKKLEIRLRLREFKQRDEEIEELKKSIIGDVLPSKRYIMYSLGHIYYFHDGNIHLDRLNSMDKVDNNEEEIGGGLSGYKINGEKKLDKNIITRDNRIINNENRNIYLSFYEKTYNETTLLMLIGLLRNNFVFYKYHTWAFDSVFFNKKMENDFMYKNLKEIGIEKVSMYFICLLKIKEEHKELITDEIILRMLGAKHKLHARDNESFVLRQTLDAFDYTRYNKKNIPQSFQSIKSYKEKIEIMEYFTLRIEESVIGNKELIEYLKMCHELILKDLSLKNETVVYTRVVGIYSYYRFGDNSLFENYNSTVISEHLPGFIKKILIKRPYEDVFILNTTMYFYVDSKLKIIFTIDKTKLRLLKDFSEENVKGIKIIGYDFNMKYQDLYKYIILNLYILNRIGNNNRYSFLINELLENKQK